MHYICLHLHKTSLSHATCLNMKNGVKLWHEYSKHMNLAIKYKYILNSKKSVFSGMGL